MDRKESNPERNDNPRIREDTGGFGWSEHPQRRNSDNHG